MSQQLRLLKVRGDKNVDGRVVKCRWASSLFLTINHYIFFRKLHTVEDMFIYTTYIASGKIVSELRLFCLQSTCKLQTTPADLACSVVVDKVWQRKWGGKMYYDWLALPWAQYQNKNALHKWRPWLA
jgi:hypothetical protein